MHIVSVNCQPQKRWLAPLQGGQRMGLHIAGQNESCKCSSAVRWPTSSTTSTRPSPSTSSSWTSWNCTFFSCHSLLMFSSFCHISVSFLRTTLCFTSSAVSLCNFASFLLEFWSAQFHLLDNWVSWSSHLLTSWSDGLVLCRSGGFYYGDALGR